eukprot:11273643-Karenia_brevis.AAC.1
MFGALPACWNLGVLSHIQALSVKKSMTRGKMQLVVVVSFSAAISACEKDATMRFEDLNSQILLEAGAENS